MRNQNHHKRTIIAAVACLLVVWQKAGSMAMRLPGILLLAYAPVFAATPGQATTRPAITSRPAANLLHNGDFEKLERTGKWPLGWRSNYPDNIKRIDAGPLHGQIIEMTGEKALMSTYGVDLISSKIPFKPGTRYRCTGYTKSTGPKMIVFVKGYAILPRHENGEQATGEEVVYQMRRDVAASPDWQPFNLDFAIKPVQEFSDFQHRIEYLRITLWAYWPVGTCWFDDIRFEAVGPVSANAAQTAPALTHAGTKPRLAKREPSTGSDIDPEDLWNDAANAFADGRFAHAEELAEQLLVHSPDQPDYHLLAARSAARLKHWQVADKHALWLLHLDPPATVRVEPWQQDWARLVHGQVLLRTGDIEQGKSLLIQVASQSTSPHAKAAAQQILDEN